MRPQRIGRRLAEDPTMTNESMTFARALRLGAEALRADAESSAPGELAADAGAHAEDLAAAAVLEAEISRLAEFGRVADVPEDESFPEDRVSAGVGSAEDLADVIANAIGAENLRVAEVACEILASMLQSGSATLGEDLRNRFAEALRLDWSHPI